MSALIAGLAPAIGAAVAAVVLIVVLRRRFGRAGGDPDTGWSDWDSDGGDGD